MMTNQDTTNNWHPGILTGLQGSRYPEEELHPHTPQGKSLHEPSVYILKCSQPSDWGTVEERWNRVYEIGIPDFIHSAFDAKGVLYVGGAKDTLNRIHEHLESPNRSASILHVFPIHSVWGVEWMNSAEEAFERESGIALELANQLPGYHVHQN